MKRIVSGPFFKSVLAGIFVTIYDMKPFALLCTLAFALPSFAARHSPDFNLFTIPSIPGLEAGFSVSVPENLTLNRGSHVWCIEAEACNTTPDTVRFKLVLSAEPHFRASRYLIPGVLYNGNEFVGDFFMGYSSSSSAVSTDMPYGWEKDGQPWIFAGDRSSIPACSISENSGTAFALFSSDSDLNSVTGSSSLEKLPDGSFRHSIYWPVTEAPVSYTDKRSFSERYDNYVNLPPGETFRVTAFACEGRPVWKNYGFTAVFPVAWQVLEHKTSAQHSIDETVRLDRQFLDWPRRQNEEGCWFSDGHDDVMVMLGHLKAPRSKDGYTLSDYENDFTLDHWVKDDVDKSKSLRPGEYLEGAGGPNIGFASQSFQRARVTLEYALMDGDREGVRFAIEVFRSWIRVRQQESGFFRRKYAPVPWKTITDASEVGWAISELVRTVVFIRSHREEMYALGFDADVCAGEFEDSAGRVVRALLSAQPSDGGLGSQWDYSSGALANSEGDCGGFVLMGLVRYWKLTRDPAVKKAIDRAFRYYYARDIDRFVCNGGAMDCASVDREGIQPFLSAAVEMWEMTGRRKYLQYARKAGWYFLSWVYLQNPVYGPDRDFSRYNWRPAGATIVGTEHPGLDDYGNLVIPELFALSLADKNGMWRDVAALMWRNGTQGFADENRRIWHCMERPAGSKNEAWFQTRWSKYRTGENKRGSLNDHLMAWGGTYRLASLLELPEESREWLAGVAEPCTQIVLSNDYGTARVDIRGAVMRSWIPAGGEEVLGNSGINLFWPWTGSGLAPYYDWNISSRTEGVAVLTLDDSESSRRVWPHRFHAELEYCLGDTLNVKFRVVNTDSHEYACDGLLQAFLRVSHPSHCSIRTEGESRILGDQTRRIVADFGNVEDFCSGVDVEGAVYMAGGNHACILEPGESLSSTLSLAVRK